MKFGWIMLLILAVARAGLAATPGMAINPAAGGQYVGVCAQRFVFQNGLRQQMVYSGYVVATNAMGSLHCDKLTIDLPSQGSTNQQPTHALAENHVTVDFVKDADTNHITCDQAIYLYEVSKGETNDTITFLGSDSVPAKMQNSKGWMTGQPLVYDNTHGNFSGVNVETHFRVPASENNPSNRPPSLLPSGTNRVTPP